MMRSDEKVKVEIELPRISLWRAFMPAIEDGGGYYVHCCIHCSWRDKIWVGYSQEPNPKPHTCPVGEMMRQIEPIF